MFDFRKQLKIVFKIRETQVGDCDAERCCVPQIAAADWNVLSFWQTITSSRLICMAVIAMFGCQRVDNAERFQIASSSMAPHWLGPHFKATCNTCGQVSPIAREAYDPMLPTRCFSCGGLCNVSDEVTPGDVVELVRTQDSQRFKRFDVVVFAQPNSPKKTVKRIWGLPEEKIELRGGEAWIDGKLLQKNISELARVSVPLSSFPDDSFSHWWIVEADGNLSRIENAVQAGVVGLAPGQLLELRYVVPSRVPSPASTQPSSIFDDYPLNQNSVAQLHPVDDFFVSVELANLPTAAWEVAIRSRGREYKLQVVKQLSQETNVPQTNAPQTNAPQLLGRQRILVSVCDHRLMAASETEQRYWDLDSLEYSHAPAVSPIIKISSSSELKIRRLAVARDLWLGPRGSRMADWSDDTDTTGLFVLGDNLSISVDSREPSFGRIVPRAVQGILIETPVGVGGWRDKLE